MSKKKSILKSIKAPDALQKKLALFFTWLLSHKVKVGGMLFAFVVIYGGVLTVQHYMKKQSLVLSSELAAIDELYEEELTATNKQREEITKKMELIEKAMTAAATSDEKTKDGKQPPVSPFDPAKLKEKMELEKKLSEIKENHQGSLIKYQEFYKGHKKDVVGAAAAFKSAMILLKDNDYTNAKLIFEGVRKDFADHPFYSVQSLLNLSAILEQEGSFEESLKLLDEALTKAPKEIKAQVLLAKARLEYLSKQNTKAATTIEEIVKNHGESEEAKKAKALKVLVN